MNQKELRVIEDLVDGVKTMAKNIKELNDTLKKNSSNTDKNTIMYKLVDAVKDLGKKFKQSEQRAEGIFKAQVIRILY